MTLTLTLTILLVVSCLHNGAAYSLSRPVSLIRASTSTSSSVSYRSGVSVDMRTRPEHFKLFAEGPKITRENEEEYFVSDFDEKPLKERLPYALGFLGAVSLPFIIGLIYLYSSK